jgi:transcriptional regulator with XRE-family HTH domain
MEPNPAADPELAAAAARAMELARRLRPPMKRFAYELRLSLGRPSLSRQAIYEWERERSRVPAEALIAAARLLGISVDELLEAARRQGGMGEVQARTVDFVVAARARRNGFQLTERTRLSRLKSAN